MTGGHSSLEAARAVADAVLYEGYVLYPYRATAGKNQLRFQWGVLMPPDVVALDSSERSSALTTVLLDGPARRVTLTVRLLQVQRRTVEAADGTVLERLEAGEVTYLPFDEACPHELTFEVPLDGAGAARTFDIEGGVSSEEVPGGRLRRERLPLRLRVEATVERPSSPYQLAVLGVRIANDTALPSTEGGRSEWLRNAVVAAHVLLEVDAGRFVSLLEPPQWAAGFAAGCRHDGLFPVLAGPDGDQTVMLSSPIILYDHPALAPESASPFFDSLEIDELLSLRTLTLSEAEKREARGTDVRVASMLDDVEGLPPELWGRLHGSIRSLGPSAMPRIVRPDAQPQGASPDWGPEADAAFDPDTDEVVVAGATLRRGSPVLLRPGARRADAYDLLLAGRRATVTGVFRDFDDRVHLAVVVDDDPGADLRIDHGRFLYFAPDEVEPLPDGAAR